MKPNIKKTIKQMTLDVMNPSNKGKKLITYVKYNFEETGKIYTYSLEYIYRTLGNATNLMEMYLTELAKDSNTFSELTYTIE